MSIHITDNEIEPLIQQLQKCTDDILCISGSQILVNPCPDGLVLLNNIDDKYTFLDAENNHYTIFGKSIVEKWQKVDDNIEEIEIEPVYGEPIVDIVKEIIDNGIKLEPIQELIPILSNNVKLIKIVSADRKSVIEIIVPEKSNYEIIEHSII